MTLFKRSICFTFLFLSFSLWANTIVQSRVYDIDYGAEPQDDTLILLENGSVLRIEANKNSLLLSKNRLSLKFSVDKNNYILDVQEKDYITVDESFSNEATPYEPTVVNGLATAEEYFTSSKTGLRDSQCFNRAHVWSYELWTKHQVKSQKIFLFFSRRYIREKKFKWWFHVAPMILVNDGTQTVERVLDPTFNKTPLDVIAWKSFFIGKEVSCPTIAKYSDYADYPYVNDCSIIKVPMYIHQPLDLEMQEVWGLEKTGFSPVDLKTAYKEAFRANYNEGN